MIINIIMISISLWLFISLWLSVSLSYAEFQFYDWSEVKKCLHILAFSSIVRKYSWNIVIKSKCSNRPESYYEHYKYYLISISLSNRCYSSKKYHSVSTRRESRTYRKHVRSFFLSQSSKQTKDTLNTVVKIIRS